MIQVRIAVVFMCVLFFGTIYAAEGKVEHNESSLQKTGRKLSAKEKAVLAGIGIVSLAAGSGATVAAELWRLKVNSDPADPRKFERIGQRVSLCMLPVAYLALRKPTGVIYKNIAVDYRSGKLKKDIKKNGPWLIGAVVVVCAWFKGLEYYGQRYGLFLP